jgi:N-glycosylase/DNA lyase
MTWKEIVKDPNEIKVFMALDGPQLTWRTVGGIARQTGLPEDHIWRILSKYDKELTRLSEVPSASGNPLVGLRERVDN